MNPKNLALISTSALALINYLSYNNQKTTLLLILTLIFTHIFTHLFGGSRPVLLLDYSCYLPPPDRRSIFEINEYFCMRSHKFSPSSEDFMRAIYKKSGLGEETYGPPYIFQHDYDNRLACAVQEVEEGVFGAVKSLLDKTKIEVAKIGYVIIGCSMYWPSPSIASMVVNKFGLDEGIKTYNLSGMGCSGGTVSVDLAKRLLKRKVGYVLIVLTESLSINWYFGNDRHMLVPNCIFRVGTAAAIITNDPAARPHAKMELVRTLRTHHGSDDASYNAAIQKEDDQGNVGVSLTQDLVRVAGQALKNHISTLAPRVLPVSELLRYVCNITKLMVAGEKKAAGQYVPDFKKAFEHMCIHAGGKAVIDAVGKIMKFDTETVEPARMCLHRFGNTSSSLVFYELAYFEAKERIKKGDRVWMLAFGTGFKACSVVWKALMDSSIDVDNPWRDCVHRYPV